MKDLPRRDERRRVVWTLAAIAVIAFALRAAALGGQPLLPDDLDVAETARNFVERGSPQPTMWNHPRLRDLLVHASVDLLGSLGWGIRAWSLLLGALAAPAVAWLVWSACASLPAAGIAGLLVATDPLHVDFSRQGINDVYLSLFPVVATVALLRYAERRRPAWLALAGALLGLGLASKWSAAFPVAVGVAFALGPVLAAERGRRERGAELALAFAALVALPLAVYVLTFWPYFGGGHDLAELARLHAAMALETTTHAGYVGTKQAGFPGEIVAAWRWFAQPIWYVDYLPAMPGRADVPPGGLFVSGVANPLAWLPTLPAAAWAAWRWLRARDRGAGLLVASFLATWLPFALARRPIWTNSAIAVLPFSAALVGWAAARLAARASLPVRAWGVATAVLAALLWAPAAGISTAPTDAVLRALVSREALDPASHHGDAPRP